MLVSQFNFELPRELIATSPAKPRDSAKLLVIDGNNKEDLTITDFSSFLKKGDIIIFNDTKVIPAMLDGVRYKALDFKSINIDIEKSKQLSNSNSYSQNIQTCKIQINLHKNLQDDIWLAFAKPSKKLSIDDIFVISDEFYATVLEKNGGEVKFKFNVQGEDFYRMLDKYGSPPLPPYIERQGKKVIASDFDDYQTVYAKNKGAVAAPTAGLHFTEELLNEISAKGVISEFVTLHVGAGTFLPMKVKDTKDHIMHSEYGIITQQTADRINNAKRNGGRVIAVGTTSLRLLESATDKYGIVHKFLDETDIFITPGYQFKAIDILFTNFHLPESTLFMLVCAFAGKEYMQDAYKHAIENKYRFYSYGDACLLFKM